jgi:hypothetical protein
VRGGAFSIRNPSGEAFSFAFILRGNYTLVVTNPHGDASNPVTIVVT